REQILPSFLGARQIATSRLPNLGRSAQVSSSELRMPSAAPQVAKRRRNFGPFAGARRQPSPRQESNPHAKCRRILGKARIDGGGARGILLLAKLRLPEQRRGPLARRRRVFAERYKLLREKGLGLDGAKRRKLEEKLEGIQIARLLFQR